MAKTYPKLNKKLIVFILSFSVLGVVLVVSSFAAAPNRVTDFSKYYPNTDMYKTSYLNGNNYIGGSPAWAVLWFGDFNPDGSYKMYNSNPADVSGKCHWDQFKWAKNALLYSETRNMCNTDTDIQYSPGLTYLPRKWDGSNFLQSGDSVANWYEAGQLKCSGVNHWVSEIFEVPVELSPGVKATQVRSTQTTSWNSGPGSPTTGCKPGQTSHYQENLYFVTDLPIYGSQKVMPGLKRTVGGSLDFYSQRGWDWDIWFDNWKHLP